MKAIIAVLFIAASAAWPMAAGAVPANDTHAAAPAPQVSDQDLKTFAAIRADLNDISTEYMAKLKAATSGEERKQVRRDARQAMIAAIEKHGMTLNRFRNMAKTISENEKLKQKLKAMEPGNG